MAEIHKHRRALIAAAIGVVAALVVFVVLASWNTPSGTSELALATLVQALPWAALWLASAWGYGIAVQRWLMPDEHNEWLVQISLGIAAQLFLDATFGRLGMLQLGASVGAWLINVIGVAVLARWIWPWARQALIRDLPLSPPLMWSLAPLLGVILLATTWAPGALWRTEFGGYDVLSYHMQLPKEWLALGRIQPLDHNVYSDFPCFVESAYYHLAVLQGDAIRTVYSAQLLHACMALLTAGLIYRIAWRTIPGLTALLITMLFFWTPWIIVVSTLAYDECFVLLMLATGIYVVSGFRISAAQRGMITGFLSAVACGTKLTSIGFVAAPLFILLLWNMSHKHIFKPIAIYSLTCLVILSPWLIHNWLSIGNPVFPLAHTIFSSDHWSPDQFSRFHNGHMPSMGQASRFLQAGQQFLWFGFGPNPAPSDPWIPQWGITPILTAIAIVIAVTTRRISMRTTQYFVILLLQCIFWMFFTHIKSRFALPMIVPSILIIGELIGAFVRTRDTESDHKINDMSPLQAILITLGCLLISISCTLVYVRDPSVLSGHVTIGLADTLAGRNLDKDVAHELSESSSAIFLNTQLPADSRILLIGEAAPLYITAHITYNTTWNSSILSQAIRQHPDSPSIWIDQIRERGFTHLLINRTMLDVWDAAGWNDPALSISNMDSLTRILRAVAKPFPNNVMLYDLRAITERTSSSSTAPEVAMHLPAVFEDLPADLLAGPPH